MTTTTTTLTPRQLDVLQWVDAFIATHDYAPTYRQIASGYGWTVNGARTHVAALIRKGVLEQHECQARTLRLTPAGKALVGGDA